jgi:hypothetical protein
VAAAAGYPQYSGNLIHPIISMELIERFYQVSIFGEISTTEYIGELTKGGDQITFWREPTVIVRDYVKGGQIEHDTLDTEPITLVIDKAKTFSLKIDKIDEKQMQMWEVLKAAFMKNAARTMSDMIDGEILGSVYADVDQYNQGATAGVVSGAYNLGTTGAPVPVTSTNVVEVFTSMQGVLDEAAIPEEGRFIVVPGTFKNLLVNSELKAAYLTGQSESPLLNGKLPNKIAGFDVPRSPGLRHGRQRLVQPHHRRHKTGHRVRLSARGHTYHRGRQQLGDPLPGSPGLWLRRDPADRAGPPLRQGGVIEVRSSTVRCRSMRHRGHQP